MNKFVSVILITRPHITSHQSPLFWSYYLPISPCPRNASQPGLHLSSRPNKTDTSEMKLFFWLEEYFKRPKHNYRRQLFEMRQKLNVSYPCTTMHGMSASLIALVFLRSWLFAIVRTLQTALSPLLVFSSPRRFGNPQGTISALRCSPRIHWQGEHTQRWQHCSPYRRWNDHWGSSKVPQRWLQLDLLRPTSKSRHIWRIRRPHSFWGRRVWNGGHGNRVILWVHLPIDRLWKICFYGFVGSVYGSFW